MNCKKRLIMKTIRDVMNIRVNDFEFSVRCSNCMKRMGIDTLSQLTSISEKNLSNVKNMGKKSIDEISNKLNSLDLYYGMTDRDWARWGLSHLDLVKAL